MSIHVQLSPEAAEHLRKQRRNSTISSIFIAVMTIAIVAVLLFLVTLGIATREVPVIVTYHEQTVTDPQADPQTDPVPLRKTPQRKPTEPSASANMAKVIASQSNSALAVPTTHDITSEPSLDYGGAEDFGTGWGDGKGFGGAGGTGGGEIIIFGKKSRRIPSAWS